MTPKWLCYLLILITAQVMAAETDALTTRPNLTLRQVLNEAVARNPQRHMLQAMDGVVQARYTHARGVLPAAPAVSLRHLNDSAGSGRGEREWETELELPLWLPGQRSARELVASESKANLAASKAGLMLQVAGVLRDAVWDVRMNVNNVELIAQRLRTAEALQRDVERRFQAGELARTDFLLAQDESLQMQTALLRAQAELKHAQHRYRVLTGLSEFPAQTEEPVSDKSSLGEQHPYLREAESKVALAQTERELLRVERRENPQLMLAARSQRDAFDGPYNNSVGVKLRFPFDTAVRTAPLMAAAASNVARFASELERLRYAMETVLHEAEHNLEVTREELELVTRQNRIAQEGQRLGEKAFSLGETDLIHLMRVRALAYEAERALSSRRIQLQWDIARYNQAVGVLP